MSATATDPCTRSRILDLVADTFHAGRRDSAALRAPSGLPALAGRFAMFADEGRIGFSCIQRHPETGAWRSITVEAHRNHFGGYGERQTTITPWGGYPAAQ